MEVVYCTSSVVTSAVSMAALSGSARFLVVRVTVAAPPWVPRVLVAGAACSHTNFSQTLLLLTANT